MATHRTVTDCSPSRAACSPSEPTTYGAGSTRSRSTSPSGKSGERCCTAGEWWWCRSRSPVRRRSSSHCCSASDVTVLNQTPSAFYQLMAAEERRPEAVAGLRAVVFGGEALDPARLAGWWTRHATGGPAAGQHVRHHRDHGPCHLPGTGAPPAIRTGSVIGRATPGAARLRAGRAAGAGAHGRGGRDVCGRCAARPRLPGPTRR